MSNNKNTNTNVKKKVYSEQYEQQLIIRWWDGICKDSTAIAALQSNLLMHIPNGTLQAMKMKQRGLGVRSGVPDLFLAIPRGGYHGLWIELKRTRGGIISPEQIDFITLLKQQHYAAYVCKGHDSAIDLIKTYLTSPDSLVAGRILFESSEV